MLWLGRWLQLEHSIFDAEAVKYTIKLNAHIEAAAVISVISPFSEINGLSAYAYERINSNNIKNAVAPQNNQFNSTVLKPRVGLWSVPLRRASDLSACFKDDH